MSARTILLAAMTLAICLVPLASEEADGDGTESGRLSTTYLFECQLVIPEYITEYIPEGAVIDDYLDYRGIYMIEGSENHARMERYLADVSDGEPSNDQDVDVTEDDRDLLLSSAGSVLHVYYMVTYDRGSIWCNFLYESLPMTKVLDPYSSYDSYIARQGDTLTVTLTRADASFGTVTFGIRQVGMAYNMYTIGVGETVEFESPSTSAYEVSPYSSSTYLYVDYSFTVEGDSVPNGSAAAFAAVCFVIAAVVIAVLALAAMGPRWAK